jgi:hypothetical protein
VYTKQTSQIRGQTSILPEPAATIAAKFVDPLVNMILTPTDSDEHDAREQLGIRPQVSRSRRMESLKRFHRSSIKTEISVFRREISSSGLDFPV